MKLALGFLLLLFAALAPAATASFTNVFPSSPDMPLAVQISANVSIGCTGCTQGNSDISDSHTLELTTAGPVRPGIVKFVTYDGSNGAAEGFRGTWSLDLQTGLPSGDLTGGCVSDGVASGCGGYLTDPDYPFAMPITLGTTLTLTETVQASVFLTDYFGGTAGSVYGSSSIYFFEADGTPVQILDASAPEPATWTLAALPLALLFWRFRKSLP